MSALARYFIATQKYVAGYDKTASDITKSLQKIGIDIHFNDDVTKIPVQFLNKKETLIVYTPAVAVNHQELLYFNNNTFSILKRSEVLGLITNNTFCLAVAGTHGKTTTTSILSHLMFESNIEITAFLGGISENYKSNLIQSGSKVFIVEADEFDRSFLTLAPDYACITSMDADHLDVYGNTEGLNEAFIAFTKKLKPNGKLFVKKGLPFTGITYAIEEEADYMVHNIKVVNGIYVFDIKTPYHSIQNLEFKLPGRHNLSNALIALAMALEFGCSPTKLVGAIASYEGVKRRFTYHIRTNDMVLIDDYAHHPEEINAVHQAIREMYPNKEVLVVFQPHLFSRTKDFIDEFALSLQKFDSILLLEIYPARELPIHGINSERLLNKIDNPNKKLISKSDIVSEIQKSNINVIITMGAGDIGQEVKTIKKSLSIAS